MKGIQLAKARLEYKIAISYCLKCKKDLDSILKTM
jgi:hypothetical protein